MTLRNEDWQNELRRGYERRIGKKRSIRLPTANQITFEGTIDLVKVSLKNETCLANMQTDGAAFEAWCIALKVWCGVREFTLEWDVPKDWPKGAKAGHYERFLYRAQRFGKMFHWFRVARPENLRDAGALNTDGRLFLNVARERAGEPTAKAGSEAWHEQQLLTKGLKTEFELEQLDRQFPVGLFKGEVSGANQLFTAKKSAIDLIGISSDTFWIFELKMGKNAKTGILSELLFYANVMRDSISVPGFPPAPFGYQQQISSGTIWPEHVTKCKRIKAVLLAEEFHPLVRDNSITDTLNAGRWSVPSDRVPVTFDACTVVHRNGEYEFTRLREEVSKSI